MWTKVHQVSFVQRVVVVQLRVRFLTCRPVPGTWARTTNSKKWAHTAAAPARPMGAAACVYNAHIVSLSDTPSLPVSIAATVNFAQMQTKAANDCQLDGQGKARREALGRRNSECKINLSSPNSSRSNGSTPTAQR